IGEGVRLFLRQLWNVYAFYARYAPFGEQTDAGETDLDRWIRSRVGATVEEVTARLDDYDATFAGRAIGELVDDLSNWYVRRSRRRFWEGDASALRSLWDALTAALQVIAPVMPFLAEHLWRDLVGEDESVFLAGWPDVGEPDETMLAEVAEVRRVVELGRQARAASGMKLRQPLRRLVVAGGGRAVEHADEIAEELRVKDVEFGDVEASELRVKPNLPVLGPKLGPGLRDVRAALQEGRYESLDDGRFRVNGHVLEPDEVLVEHVGKEGWAVV